MSNNRIERHDFPVAAVLSIVAWGVGLGVAFTLDDPRLRFPSYAAGIGLASLGWLGLIREAKAARLRGPEQHPHLFLFILLGLGLVARCIALGLPPAFSEDIFRYIYEGRVVWHYGWAFPFAHAPAEALHLAIAPELLDHAWLRINHPELSTIYPPFAQLTFVAAAGAGELFGGGHLSALKTTLVLADLGTWIVLAMALRAAGRPIAESVVWGLSPLPIVEIAREGHADSLSAFGLALGIYGFARARPPIGYAGWALAALAKLNGLIALPAAVRTTRRGLWAAAVLVPLVAVPYLFAGETASAGLAAYASRWRAGDGAFSVILAASGALLGGEWARFESIGPGHAITVTRHQLARVLVAGLFGLASLAVLFRSASIDKVPARAGLLLLLLLLLSPTLHPWYVLWLLPFAACARAFEGRRAVLALACLAPLLHHPGWLELLDGRWRDIGWVRAIVHLPVWALLVADLAASRRTR